MKATIETVTGVTMTREIDTSDSPMGIIRKFYEEDAAAASQIFPNQKAIERFMEGIIDEGRVEFDIINTEGDGVRANWQEPLCNQPAIKEELSKVEAEGQVPTFVVCVSCSGIA